MPKLLALPSIASLLPVDEFTYPVAMAETHLPRLLKVTIITLASATLGFVLWAALTPVKEVARTEGQIMPSGYSQLVQHLEGGLIRDILVREGDLVQKDQVLIQLNGAGTEQDYREQQKHQVALRLKIERLKAYLENRKPNFAAIAEDENLISEQQHLFEANEQARSSERNIMQEQVRQHERGLERLRLSAQTAQANLAISHESRQMYADLQDKGMASRAALLTKQQEYNSRQGDAQSLGKHVAEAANELKEYQQRYAGLIAQQRNAALTELNTAGNELNGSDEDMQKRSDRLDRLEVRAPVTGYVKGLKANTIGAVVGPGQTLMEIIPADDQLMAEIRIPTNEIGRVQAGQDVQVKVDSFDYVRYGTISGTLSSISAMTFIDEAHHQEYYRGKLRLSKLEIGSGPHRYKLIPGMTLDADIVTGQKTVLAYLLKPIRSALFNSLSEQ